MTKSNRSVLDSSLAVEVTNQWCCCCCCIGVDMRPKGGSFLEMCISSKVNGWFEPHTAGSWLEVVELVRFRCRWSMISIEGPSSSIFDQGFPYSATGSSTSIEVVVVILEVSEVVSRGPSLFNCHAITFSWWSQFHVVNIWSSKMMYEIRRESGEEIKRKRASLYDLQRLLDNFGIIFR